MQKVCIELFHFVYRLLDLEKQTNKDEDKSEKNSEVKSFAIFNQYLTHFITKFSKLSLDWFLLFFF